MTPRVASPLSGSPWSKARWLVLAPHPDDETIGAGALIRETAREGRLAAVAFVTDGAGSHPATPEIGARALAAIRRQEARVALRRLAIEAPRPLFIDWPDGRPPGPDERNFRLAAMRLGAICRARRVDAIAVTASHEPHCDHAAACGLAHAAARASLRPLRVFEYVVWADREPDRTHRCLKTGRADPGRRRGALAAHRSQLTPLMGDGFRVPDRLRRMAPHDLLYVRVSRHEA